MKRTYLVLIITMLVIGFAAVSANLVLSGTLKLGFNSEEFEEGVIFTKAESINGLATIQENEKTINYQTYKLDEIGEESVLDYVLTNKSNQYDADVTIECSLNNDSSTYEDYIELSNEDISGSFTLSAGETKDGRVKVKLKKSYVASDNTQIEFTCAIVATAKEKEETVEYQPKTIYTETALNGADPVLEGNGISTVSLEEKEEKKLIPVNISDNGTVTYADITEKWYDYENQQWANAVILSNYNNIPKVGEEIPEEDIESYFVWIPKYRYKIFDMGHYNEVEKKENEVTDNSQQIDIEFNLDDTSNESQNECATPNESGADGECEVDKWMTHPAFTAFPGAHGIWVGKFETGYKQDGLITTWTKAGAEQNDNNSSKVIIKPNVYSWRNINIYNAYATSFNYDRTLDSHMMKNTEWGAVAYLSHSKYGTCTNDICKEVRINNNSDYLTGYAAKDEPPFAPFYDKYKDYENTKMNTDGEKTINYKNVMSSTASTTGNITGIYDMVGGVGELLMALKENSYELAGFTSETFPTDKKYYDVYTNDSDKEFDKRILGDATGELGPFISYKSTLTSTPISSWYNYEAYFEFTPYSWFWRGHSWKYGDLAGIFSFNRSTGKEGVEGGFRIVLAPQ